VDAFTLDQFGPVVNPADLGNRCFFVLAGAKKLAAPPGMGKPYSQWYNQMAATLHIVIDDHNTTPFDELNLKVEEIARQIVEVRRQLYESMLASWP
jgi:hypothetical protein